MDETYQSHGVRFDYPHDWEVAEQAAQNELTITVQSPETSFWMLTLFFARPEPERISEAALDAFREEYDDLDIYQTQEQICDEDSIAWDIEFRCLEVYNSAWVRAFQTDHYSALVLSQGNDLELQETQETLRAITQSLGYYYE